MLKRYDPSKVGVVRYKSHGNRFELVCSRSEYAALIEKLNGGRITLPLDSSVMKRVILSSTVFENAHKWEASSKNSRGEAFGDPEASDHMYSTILVKGEMLASEQERNDRHVRQQEADSAVCAAVRFMLRNIYTGVEPEADDTTQAIQTIKTACHIKVGAHAPVVVQAGVLASMVADKLECLRVASKVVVCHPFAYSAKWDVFLHDYAPVALSLHRTVSKDGKTIEQILLADNHLLKDGDWLSIVDVTKAEVVIEEASVEDTRLFSKQQYDMPTQPDTPVVTHVAPLIKRIKVVEEPKAAQTDESKWTAMTHKNLQQECKKRGLSTGGSKAVLVDRVMSHDE